MTHTDNPFTDDPFAKHVGIELLTAEPGHAKAKLTIKPHHLNGAGVLHGGAIYTLAVWTMAIAANQSSPNLSVGVSATISYTKAIANGEIFAHANLLSSGRKLSTYIVDVIDSQNEIIAAFQGQTYTKTSRQSS